MRTKARSEPGSTTCKTPEKQANGTGHMLQALRSAAVARTAGLLFIFSAAVFAMVETVNYSSYVGGPWSYKEEMTVFFYVVNIGLYFSLMEAGYILSKRPVPGILLSAGTFYVFANINRIVLESCNRPIMPGDLRSIATAATIAEGYPLITDTRFAISTGLLVLILIACVLLHKAGALVKTDRGSWKKGSMANSLLAGTVMLLCAFILTSSGTMPEKSKSAIHIYPNYWRGQTVNGTFPNLLLNLTADAGNREPDMYDPQECSRLLASYAKPDAAEVKPDIIVIMDEAFSDITQIRDFETEEEILPFIRKMEREGTAEVGTAYSSVFGGNTPVSEWEFLTGNSSMFVGVNTIAYTTDINDPKQSMVSYLNQLGYDTLAFHPYSSVGWNRIHVYSHLGFDRVCFGNNMVDNGGITEIPRDTTTKYSFKVEHTSGDYYGKFISDAFDMKYVEKLYKESKERSPQTPLFLFNVTMQNHVGNTAAPADRIKTAGLKVEGIESIERHLHQLNLTDAALEDLISFFSGREEPVVVVFFGDHRATLEGQFYHEAEENLFAVPYVIWTNFTSPEAGEVMSINYLGATLLERIGLLEDPYFCFVSTMKEKYPILSGRYGKEATGPMESRFDLCREHKEDEALNSYRKMQYYNMHDRPGW